MPLRGQPVYCFGVIVAAILLSLLLGQGTTAQPAPQLQPLLERGEEALARGDLPAAESAFEEARRLEPDNPVVYSYLGELHARRREYGEALADFRKAIRLAPSEPQPYFRLAVLQARLERFHDARQTLNELLEARPDYPDTYLLLGRIAGEQGDHAAAEEHLRRYVRLQPEDPQGLGELGVVLLARENFQEAEAFLKRVLEIDPESEPAHHNLGRLYSRRGEHERAREHLEAATRLLPGNAEGFYQLGTVLMRMGELAEAETAFRRALALEPENLEARYALGTLLRRQGRSEEAAEVLAEHERLSARALEERQRQRRISAYHLDARKLLEQDRLEEAREKLQEILALEPENDLAYYRLGQLFFLRREYERALEAVRSAIRAKDFEPAYHFLEGMCWDRLGEAEKAARAFERVVELADYADAYRALGRIELGRGNYPQAVARLRRAVELEPQDPDLRLALAEALEKAGYEEEARKQMAEAEALRSGSGPR